ncbi:MAG: hypothetical protein EOM53_02935 [Alphaproteobacteria bacterium]|nr:hypothetical protein [Alphaproteobacteria bacterium]NCB49619.1 hypothetical protein [Alphaproteobacteria bacterium]
MILEENGQKSEVIVVEEDGRKIIELTSEGHLSQNGISQQVVLTQNYDVKTHILLSERVVSKIEKPVQALVTTEVVFSSLQKLMSVSNSFSQSVEEDRNLKRILKFDEAGRPKVQNFILLMEGSECKIYESWNEEGDVSRKAVFRFEKEDPQTFSVTVKKDGTVLNEKSEGEDVMDFLEEIGKPRTNGALMHQFPIDIPSVLNMNREIKDAFKDISKKALTQAFTE